MVSAPRIDNIESNTQPATTSTDGIVKKNVWQVNPLTSDVTTTTSDHPELRFENLVIGKVYKVTLHCYMRAVTNVNSRCTVNVVHDGSTLTHAEWNFAVNNNLTTLGSTEATKIFKATATTVSFDVDIANGAILESGGSQFTYSMLEQLENYGDEVSTF
jgi:isochorismate synthase EntC